MDLPSSIATLGTIQHEDIGAVFCLDVWACLGVNPLDMLKTPYWVGEEKYSQQPTMPYNPSLTSSSVHHSSHNSTALFLSCYNVT